MIDWVIIISTAVDFMMAFITKDGEIFAAKAGEELFDIIKKKFREDKEGQSILSNFREKPTRYQNALIDVLKEKIETDKPFGNEIWNIVEKNSTNIGGVTQIATGNGNAQAAGNGATATIRHFGLPGDSTTDAPPPSPKKRRKR